MRRLIAIMTGMLLGGVLVYVAFEYHVVRTDKTVYLIPKRSAGLTDAYVDIRDWTASQWKDHPVLVENMIADGHGELVGGSFAGGLLNEFVAPFTQDGQSTKRPWWRSNDD